MKKNLWTLPPDLSLLDSDNTKIKWYHGFDYALKGIKSQNYLSIINAFPYPAVVAEHDFAPSEKMAPIGEHTCKRCGLRAIKDKNGGFTLHRLSWKTDDLTGKETCNELLMRKVLG